MARTLSSLALAALALAALCVSSCPSAEGDEAHGGDGDGAARLPAASEYVDELAEAGAEFAFSLYGKLSASEGNLFFSPHSIMTALAMTYVGARGETESQMAQALELPDLGAGGEGRFTPDYRGRLAASFGALSGELQNDTPADAHVFAEANALWYQTGYALRDRFLSLNTGGFGARVTDLDFSERPDMARDAINEWVEEKTLGKIAELIRPGDIDPLVRIVLTNAVYFKGMWDEQFDPGATSDAPFHMSPGDAEMDVEVPMMSRKGDYAYAWIEDPGLELLELPYAGGRASMVILLPEEQLTGGLSALEQMLTRENVDTWLSRMGKREALVSIPRFDLTWGTENIIPALEALGMTHVFSDRADLSGIDGTQELYVSRVLHKAYVKVNEEGTEAAAATAVVGRLKASMPLSFRADRPFLFLIRDTDTGAILFMGRVVDPSA